MGQTAELCSELGELLGQFTVDRFYRNDASKLGHPSPTGIHPLEAGVTQSTSRNDMFKFSMAPDKNVETEIKIWKVTSDGTSEPIYPPGWKGPQNIPPRSILANDPGKQRESPTFTQQVTVPSPPNETKISPQQSDSQKPEDISAVNDAYDDILHKRGPGMHKISEALAKNRAFGREPSSLQREDGPVLSISEEEVQRYNDAAEMGYKDMEELEECFDANHESVTATKAESEKSAGKQLDEKIVIGGIEISGFGSGK